MELGGSVVVKGTAALRQNVAFSQGEPLGRVDLERFAGDRSAGPASPSTKNLMHPVSRKPISSVPKLANRTPLALVIDSLLVRTANYAIGDRDGSHLVPFDKFKYLAGNVWIGADVATIHFPVA